MFMLKFVLILLALLSLVCTQDYLMKIKLSGRPTSNTTSYTQALVGMSFSWADFRLIRSKALLFALFGNSLQGYNYDASLSIGIRASRGSGYLCATGTTWCTFNGTTSDLYYVGYLMYNYMSQPIQVCGISFETVNNTMQNSLLADLYSRAGSTVFVQAFGEDVDKYESLGLRPAGYNMSQYVSEIAAWRSQTNVSTGISSKYVAGPFVSSKSSWMQDISLMNTLKSDNTSVTGGFYMSYFDNVADISIDNLLSETYMQNRINTDFTADLKSFIRGTRTVINPMRLDKTEGVDGVSNTFAAALWVLDWSLEMGRLGVKRVLYETTLSATNYNAIFSTTTNLASGNITIKPLYYGMIAYNFLMKSYTQVGETLQLTNPNNYSIKAWTLYHRQNNLTTLVLINKERNIFAKGNVKVTIPNVKSAKMWTMEATDLLAKTGIKIMGFCYDGTTTALPNTGSFSQTILYPNADWEFTVPVAYAQAVVVEFGTPMQIVSSPAGNWSSNLSGSLFFLLGLLYVLVFS